MSEFKASQTVFEKKLSELNNQIQGMRDKNIFTLFPPAYNTFPENWLKLPEKSRENPHYIRAVINDEIRWVSRGILSHIGEFDIAIEHLENVKQLILILKDYDQKQSTIAKRSGK